MMLKSVAKMFSGQFLTLLTTLDMLLDITNRENAAVVTQIMLVLAEVSIISLGS